MTPDEQRRCAMCAVNSRNTTMHPILVKIRRRNNQECLGGTGLTGGHEFSAGKGSVETITPPQSRSLKSQRRPPRAAQPSFNVNDPRWMWLHWSESSTECQGCIGAIGQFVFVPPFRVEWLCIRIASAPQSHDSIHHRARAKCQLSFLASPKGAYQALTATCSSLSLGKTCFSINSKKRINNNYGHLGSELKVLMHQ